MAQNETLDLFHRNSGRWRRLCELIARGEPDEEIVQQVRVCLFRTFQNLHAYLPFPKLFAAASDERADICQIVRGITFGRDFAKLFELASSQGRDRVQIAEDVAWATLDRFFDQIRLEVVGSEQWPDFFTFGQFRNRIAGSLREEVRGFAEELAANPHVPPRMPGVSAKARESRHADVLRKSVRRVNPGSYRVKFG